MKQHVVTWTMLVGLLGCESEQNATAATTVETETGSLPAAAAASVEQTREPTPLEVIQTKVTLTGAIEYARPLMSDTVDEASPGALLLALWSARKLTWPELAVSKNETSFARVRKDSDAERGKRMCVKGRIIQITKDATAGETMFIGLMLLGYTEIARFYAVGDTGDLVDNSRARFCGVVTGTYDYANSAGGTGHAVSLVGMFDLPGNHDRITR